MYRIRVFLAIVVTVALSPAAFAQDYRFEINPHYGFRFGGGLNVSPSNVPLGFPPYNRFSIASSGAGGVGGGVFLTENFQFTFDWTRQASVVDGRIQGGGTDEDLADFVMNTYHFGGTYHFMDSESKLRPYFNFGMGWTGSRPEINGVETFNRFSGSIGGGAKYYFHRNVGAFGQIRFMPTYVYSEPGGVWCNWYGFCWLVPDDNYLNQGDLQFGVSLRF
jgi:outer membrane protein W